MCELVDVEVAPKAAMYELVDGKVAPRTGYEKADTAIDAVHVVHGLSKMFQEPSRRVAGRMRWRLQRCQTTRCSVQAS